MCDSEIIATTSVLWLIIFYRKNNKNWITVLYWQIYANDISKVLKFYDGRYAESYNFLRLAMEQINNQLLKGGKINFSACEFFWSFLKLTFDHS